jgi:hypothetical protein
MAGVLALSVSLKMNRVMRCLDLDIPVSDLIVQRYNPIHRLTNSQTTLTLPIYLKTSYKPVRVTPNWHKKNSQQEVSGNQKSPHL